MEEILYTILICCLISFWVVGYAYIKAQNKLISHENSLDATKKKIGPKIEGLNKVKKQLKHEISELENELKELQKRHKNKN
ncbi:hypothetical protein [Desulfovulcanus sp.]